MKKLIDSWIKYIKDNSNVYCILNGDLMNNALKSSVSNVYEDTLRPSEQLYKLRDLFLPIRDKILAITTGNHERRTSKDSDSFPMRTLSTFLDLEDRWSDEGAVIILRVGSISGTKHTTNKNETRQVVYTIYVTHGSGGARTSNPALKLDRIVDADIYIHSHVHQPKIDYKGYYRIDTKNNTVAKYDRLYLITGSTVDYGGYAQIKNYNPSSNRNGIIFLNGTRKYFDVKI